MNNKSLLTVALACAVGSMQSWAQESATPQEIIEKTQAAAAMLAEKGTDGLQELSNKDSEWVWKDTYVFAYDCNNNVMTAHPIKPELAGKNLDEIKDRKGNALFADLCAAGKKANGGWVEYWWAKPGAEGDFRKISYAVQVGEAGHQVGAGVYDDAITVEELNAMVQ